MNPSDCSRRDWRLYYNGTWMLHDVHGAVYVVVEDQTLYAHTGGRPRQCAASHLSNLWPSPKAINHQGQGVYVGRRARREARRSFTVNHYYVLWPTNHRSAMGMSNSLSNSLVRTFLNTTDYPNIYSSVRNITEGESRSAAISKDIIIANELEVIFRGVPLGKLEQDRDQCFFIPSSYNTTLAKRAILKLNKQGIICR